LPLDSKKIFDAPIRVIILVAVAAAVVAVVTATAATKKISHFYLQYAFQFCFSPLLLVRLMDLLFMSAITQNIDVLHLNIILLH
jgi:hypothetical protein